jgi:asparagine synthase (glutamine-hydrolysing)
MTELMSHRGPNNTGFLFHGPGGIRRFSSSDGSAADLSSAPAMVESGAWLALGHRRLSILDLSTLGNQPMEAGGRYWIVYNGEVYNHLELRAELEKAGHRFRSHSDTEIILAAYSEWGTDSFARFNGMWALAIYDLHTNQLVLSRDRFGVKPLYYWQTPQLFAFASEIKAFTCLPGWRARVNGQAVHDFLLSGLQDHSEETMFADVRQLSPGCFARLNCQAWLKQVSPSTTPLEIVKWYDLAPWSFSGSFEEAAGRFRELLIDAVQLRLRADVPVGSCLSGGLDSSSIVCATHRLLKKLGQGHGHKTFSACSENKRFDEREYIEQVKRATAVESHFVFPSDKDLFTELERVIWHQDEPFAGTSIFAQWCVFKLAARSQITVMLDGQGADELLCGYNDFRRAFLCGLILSGRPLIAWREALAARDTPRRALGAVLRALVDAAVPRSAQQVFRGVRRNRRPPVWLRPEQLGASFPGRLACRFGHRRSAREMSLELLTGAHLQMLLHWEDRNSMAHSLESRVPFLDYRLVEFVTGLPDNFKIREGMTKAVLRKGMEDLVPAQVLKRRDKMGFVTPEEVWAREPGGEFRSRLAQAIADCQGIVSPDAMSFFEESLTGKRPYDSAVWRIICLGTWLRLFSVTA